MNCRIVRFAAISIGISLTFSASAYDTETHALMTQKAWTQSVLNQNGQGTVVSILGLDRLIYIDPKTNIETPLTPFNSYWQTDPKLAFPTYYDNDATNDGGYVQFGGNGLIIYGKYPEAFERCQMQEFNSLPAGSQQFQGYGTLFSNAVLTVPPLANDSVLPIQNWLVRGAIREDDLGFSYPAARRGIKCPEELHHSSQGQRIRSLNHFYDPSLDIPLTVLSVSLGKKVVDWATGYANSLANPPVVDQNSDNLFSYSDARHMFSAALTRELSRQQGQPYTATAAQRQADAEDRMRAWATTFRALGDVLHLLEDTAQPQHTRNDPHSIGTTDEQKAFEDYTNDRVLGISDESNGYVGAFFKGNLPSIFTAPPLGNYPGPGLPPVMFASPVRFFSTRGTLGDSGDRSPATLLTRAGLADYTNRGFFSGGTMPGVTVEKLPSTNLSQDYALVSVPCEGLLYSTAPMQGVMCEHYTAPVPDNINNAYKDQLPIYPGQSTSMFNSPPLAMKSILAAPAATLGGNIPTTAMGIAELDATANLALPRAIGYATGMINYFFRGVGGIAVTPPASGVYANLDHGQPHAMNPQGYPCVGSNTSDGCPIFGFTAVQANIQNVMNPIVESGSGNTVLQHMTNGTVVAVARYHRDQCYSPDLSGDPARDMNATQSGTSPAIYSPQCPNEMAFSLARSPYPEISVSTSIPVDASGTITQGSQASNVNGSSPILVQFDFSGDPIPINATDLFVEVVFSGTIGDTSTSDANKYEINSIAVGSVDVSEPTYNVFMNLDNYYYDTVSQSWMTVDQAQQQHFPTYDLAGEVIPSIYECSGTNKLVHYGYGGSPAGLAPGHAIRIAEILDPNAPANGNQLLTTWTVPPAGWNSASAGDDLYGQFASISGQLSSNPQTPFFVTHMSQASLESNAKGDYRSTTFNSGVGATWGDNMYWTYQAGVANLAYIPQPFVPPVPKNPPLTGSSGVFLSDPIPNSEVFLNSPLVGTCLNITN